MEHVFLKVGSEVTFKKGVNQSNAYNVEDCKVGTIKKFYSGGDTCVINLTEGLIKYGTTIFSPEDDNGSGFTVRTDDLELLHPKTESLWKIHF